MTDPKRYNIFPKLAAEWRKGIGYLLLWEKSCLLKKYDIRGG